jgi:hypothetical protein
MALYREGKWPPHGQKDDGKQCANHGSDDIDVMRFAGRPGFVSVPETRDSAISTPENTASGSPPNQAHPLLFEYFKQFQPGAENEAATFPPEQSMLPPIMPGSDVFVGLNDPHLRDMSPSTIVNGSDPGLPYTAAKLQYTADWASMLPSAEAQSLFGSQMSVPPDFVPMQSNSNERYMLDTDGFLAANGTLPDYLWDQFLSGLIIPQDIQTEVTS